MQPSAHPVAVAAARVVRLPPDFGCAPPLQFSEGRNFVTVINYLYYHHRLNSVQNVDEHIGYFVSLLLRDPSNVSSGDSETTTGRPQETNSVISALTPPPAPRPQLI